MYKVIVCLGIVSGVTAKLPPYMKTCSQNENFEKCFIENANEAVKTLVKGDAELKTPIISPNLDHPGATFQNDEFFFNLKDTHVIGLETIKVNEAKADFDNNNIEFKVKFGTVDWKGSYVAKELKKNEELTGKAHLVYIDNEYKITLKYKLEGNNISVDKVTAEYLNNPKVDFTLENIDSNKNIENLWNSYGKKRLIDESAIKFSEFLSEIFNQVFKATTYDEIFPTK